MDYLKPQINQKLRLKKMIKKKKSPRRSYDTIVHNKVWEFNNVVIWTPHTAQGNLLDSTKKFAIGC